MDERNSKYELQAARNGLTVPVINGVYLHSIYNPTKEAEAFGITNEKALAQKNKVLILGLGFGYHIEEAAKIMSQQHKTYEIVILEPNKKLVEDFVSTRNFEDKNINIICMDNVKNLFENLEFVKFLMEKPSIVKHDTSFILEKNFYTSFLAYQAPTNVSSYHRLLNANSRHLIDENAEKNFNQVIKDISSSGKVSSQSQYLLLTLNEIANTTIQGY